MHEIEDMTADGVVDEDMVHDGEVPVSCMDDGSCTFNCAVEVRLLVILNWIFIAMGDDTIPTSLPTTTFVNTLTVGVIDNEPVAILYPFLDINKVNDRGDVSIKHCIITFVICINAPLNI